jgi:predicted RNA methylase
MTLELPGVDTLPPEHLRQKALSQWFTPDDVARRLVEWSFKATPKVSFRMLEPSAGSGALVKHMHARGFVTAVEIDPRYAHSLAAQTPGRVDVYCCNYLTHAAPISRYDLTIMNPPYEGGADGKFIEKAMNESENVVALCRLNVMVGLSRHERVWSRIGVDDGSGRKWCLARMAMFSSRPSFLVGDDESGSPISDFVAVHLARHEEATVCTQVEWWT